MNNYNFLPQNRYQFQSEKTPIDPVQFQRNLSNLTPQMLDNAVIQARKQGIPDYQIEAGINFIKSLTLR